MAIRTLLFSSWMVSLVVSVVVAAVHRVRPQADGGQPRHRAVQIGVDHHSASGGLQGKAGMSVPDQAHRIPSFLCQVADFSGVSAWQNFQKPPPPSAGRNPCQGGTRELSLVICHNYTTAAAEWESFFPLSPPRPRPNRRFLPLESSSGPASPPLMFSFFPGSSAQCRVLRG